MMCQGAFLGGWTDEKLPSTLCYRGTLSWKSLLRCLILQFLSQGTGVYGPTTSHCALFFLLPMPIELLHCRHFNHFYNFAKSLTNDADEERHLLAKTCMENAPICLLRFDNIRCFKSGLLFWVCGTFAIGRQQKSMSISIKFGLSAKNQWFLW